MMTMMTMMITITMMTMTEVEDKNFGHVVMVSGGGDNGNCGNIGGDYDGDVYVRDW